MYFSHDYTYLLTHRWYKALMISQRSSNYFGFRISLIGGCLAKKFKVLNLVSIWFTCTACVPKKSIDNKKQKHMIKHVIWASSSSFGEFGSLVIFYSTSGVAQNKTSHWRCVSCFKIKIVIDSSFASVYLGRVERTHLDWGCARRKND